MKKTAFITFALLAISAHIAADNSAERIQKQLSIYNEVMRTLDVNFVDTLNYEAINRAAINAMLSKTDPYTTYYPEDETNTLNQMTTGKYAGVGAIIHPIGDTVYIQMPYYGKPAYNAGLRAGDAILAIDGDKMVGQTSSQVSQRLRGKIGTTLKVKVARTGEKKPLTMTVTRDEIQLDAVEFSTLLDGGLGYINFSDFTENSAAEFRSKIEAMSAAQADGLNGLIIDLRDNPGGIVGEAARILSYFIDEGTTVVTTKRRDKVIRTYKTQQAPLWRNLPLVVLVGESSASASEIVAGTLQDLDRAVIIGQRTFGKGLVQSVREIEGGGNLKVTVAKYYIPSGRCIQAIDYSHPHEDGRAYRMPDSLTSEFKTAHGRIVKDGGGIQPDINIKEEEKGGSLSYCLNQDSQFFLFANQYAATHKTIAPPQDFEVTDELAAEFLEYLKNTGYKYQSLSAKYMDDIKRALKFDGIDSVCTAELEALNAKLNPTLEEAFTIDNYYIRENLALELLSRYYPDKGIYSYFLRNDKALQEAIKLLNDPSRMKSILDGTAE